MRLEVVARIHRSSRTCGPMPRLVLHTISVNMIVFLGLCNFVFLNIWMMGNNQ